MDTLITPFKSEAVVVITDKEGNELNIEYYDGEVTMYGTYQSTGWDDSKIVSIKQHIEGIKNALTPGNAEIPDDFKLSIQSGKKAPKIKINFNIYSDEGDFAPKLQEFINKIEKGLQE